MSNKVKSKEDKEILTLDEVVQYTGFSKQTLYNLTHKKEITYYKPRGGKLFFLKKDVLDYLLQNKVSSNSDVERQATKHSMA